MESSSFRIEEVGVLIYDKNHELNRSDYVDFKSTMGLEQVKLVQLLRDVLMGRTKEYRPEQRICFYGTFLDQNGNKDIARDRTGDITVIKSDGREITAFTQSSVFVFTIDSLRECTKKLLRDCPFFNSKVRGVYRFGYRGTDKDNFF